MHCLYIVSAMLDYDQIFHFLDHSRLIEQYFEHF